MSLSPQAVASSAPLYTRIIDRMNYWLSLAEKADHNAAENAGRTFGRPPEAGCDATLTPSPVFACFADEFDHLSHRLTDRLQSVGERILSFGDRV